MNVPQVNKHNGVGLAAALTTVIMTVLNYYEPGLADAFGPEGGAALTGVLSYVTARFTKETAA